MNQFQQHWAWPGKPLEAEPSAPEPAPAAVAAPATPVATEELFQLGRTLMAERRCHQALVIFDYLAAVSPADAEPRRHAIAALGACGRTLEALERIVELRALCGGDTKSVADELRAQGVAGVERFNAHVAAGQVIEAERYAAALVRAMPGNAHMLGSAFVCNQVLGRTEAADAYARELLAVDPTHAVAREHLGVPAEPEPATVVDTEPDVATRMATVLASADHPLLKLRDLHDIASALLCAPLTDQSKGQIRTLVAEALALDLPVEPGSEWEAWARHYRVLMEAIDLDAILAPTPDEAPAGKVEYMTAAGKPLTSKQLSGHAKKLGAEVVFFAAADAHYVELYARWYALSVLKYADVPSMIVVHVIGGQGTLKAAAEAVGIQDERLVFAACDFDASAVSCRAYDAPPKGEAAKPIAHFQSVRFQRLGALLQQLKRPVFVSDIDLLLQRGVADLLQRCEGADVVFNENEGSFNAGSRLTANLLLAYPTEDAERLLSFLKDYLDRKLAGAEVTRWIDQVALLHARHHLVEHADAPHIAYFDTASDINNVMYPSFQEHPFRFLSLFHGFDTSSLEDPRVLGGTSD